MFVSLVDGNAHSDGWMPGIWTVYISYYYNLLNNHIYFYGKNTRFYSNL